MTWKNSTNALITVELDYPFDEPGRVYIFVWDRDLDHEYSIYWGECYGPNDCPTWVTSLFYWMASPVRPLNTTTNKSK